MCGDSRVIDIMRAAKWFVEHNIKAGEEVVVLTDPMVPKEIPTALSAAAASVGATVITAYFRALSAPGEEPPKAVVGLMKSADVVVSAASHSMSFTRARLESSRTGTKHLSAPGGDLNTYIRGSVEVYFDENEYQKMHQRGVWLADRLMKADEVRITSENGTDIKGSIRGRAPTPSTGIMCEPYTILAASFPSGEVMLPPVEGTSEGVVVLDTSMGGIGKITMPIKLSFQRGQLREITGETEATILRRLVESAGEGGDNLAEFGIGINHKAKICGKPNEDKRVAGSAHIALGSNDCFGGCAVEGMCGKVHAKYHLDGTVSVATVYVDDERIVDNGKLLF